MSNFVDTKSFKLVFFGIEGACRTEEVTCYLILPCYHLWITKNIQMVFDFAVITIFTTSFGMKQNWRSYFKKRQFSIQQLEWKLIFSKKKWLFLSLLISNSSCFWVQAFCQQALLSLFCCLCNYDWHYQTLSKNHEALSPSNSTKSMIN